MKNTAANWKIDVKSYNNIQQLKAFVEFVSNLPYATNSDKQNAVKINYLIENIDNPVSFKSWNVCLDIFDRNLQNQNIKKEGFYWRKWSAYFEKDTLEITAESLHTEHPIGHYGPDYNYTGCVFFNKEIKGKHVYLKQDINNFVKDAINYKNYITATLNEIEVEIGV